MYALVQKGISSGGYPALAKNPEFARISTEAAALFELMNLGSSLETGIGGDPAKRRALQGFIEAAGAARSRAGARYEAATETTLARPPPSDPAYDFIVTSNGDEMK